jgi:hypothetical protein
MRLASRIVTVVLLGLTSTGCTTGGGFELWWRRPDGGEHRVGGNLQLGDRPVGDRPVKEITPAR